MASLSKVFAVTVLLTGIGAIGFVGFEYFKMSGGLDQADTITLEDKANLSNDGSAAALAPSEQAGPASEKTGFFDRFKSKDTEIAEAPPEEVLTMECNQRGARKSCSVTREVEEATE